MIFCLPFARWRVVWDTQYPMYDILISLVLFFFSFPFFFEMAHERVTFVLGKPLIIHAHHRSFDDDR